MSWNLHDFCYNEFEMKEIIKIQDGIIKELCDGYFISSCSNFNKEIFPISLKVKKISEIYSENYNKLSQIEMNKGCKGINYPVIKNYFNNHWVKTCAYVQESADYDVASRLNEINKFTTDILDEYNNRKNIKINNVSIFK